MAALGALAAGPALAGKRSTANFMIHFRSILVPLGACRR